MVFGISKVSKFFKPKSQEELDSTTKKYETKLQTEQAKAEARLKRIQTKNKIRGLKENIRETRRKGKKKIKIGGFTYYA